MKKRDIVKTIIDNSNLIVDLDRMLRAQNTETSSVDCTKIQKLYTDSQTILKQTIEIANQYGLNSDISDHTIIEDEAFCKWAYPKKMDEVFPSQFRYCNVAMDKLDESFNATIEIPLRKAMRILMKKGWITNYSSANYQDAEGNRYNMFVDRANVAFIRFEENNLTDSDRAVLMPGNYGLSFIYTHIWPDKSVEEVEQELVELAQNLPQPTYAKGLEIEEQQKLY